MHPSEAYRGNAARRQVENERAQRGRKADDRMAMAILLVYQGISGARAACPDIFRTDLTDQDVRDAAAVAVGRLCR